MATTIKTEQRILNLETISGIIKLSAGFKYQNLEVNSGNNGVVWIKD